MESEIENYLPNFFLRPDLPTEVKKLERKVRFNSRVRMAFKYYENGEPVEMKRCVVESLEFSDVLHGGALFYWFEAFRGYDPKINVFNLLDSREWRELIDLQFTPGN